MNRGASLLLASLLWCLSCKVAPPPTPDAGAVVSRNAAAPSDAGHRLGSYYPDPILDIGNSTGQVNVGTLQWPTGTSNPTITQATTSGAAGAGLWAASQESSNTNGTPGDVNIGLGVPNGTGVNAHLKIWSDAGTLASIGDHVSVNGLGRGYIWLGPGPYTNSNWTLQNNGLDAQLNGVTDSQMQGNGTTDIYCTSTGVQFFSTTTAFGSGQGVIGIHNATTAPTTNPANGGVLYATTAAGNSELFWFDSAGVAYQLTPPRGSTTTTLANGTASWSSPITGWVALTWAGGGGGGAGGGGSNTGAAPGGGGGGGAQRVTKLVQVTSGTQYDLTYGAGGSGGTAGASGGQNRGGAGVFGGDSTFAVHLGAILATWPGANGAPQSGIIGDTFQASNGGTDNRTAFQNNSGTSIGIQLSGWGGSGGTAGTSKQGSSNIDNSFLGGASGGGGTGGAGGGGAGATGAGGAGGAAGAAGTNAAANTSAGGGGGGGGNNSAGAAGANGGSAGSLVIQY